LTFAAVLAILLLAMEATTPDAEKLLTVREAARRLGLGRHTLFKACERGELTIFDPNGWARVKLSDVERWLERTRRVPRGAA
jgi:excisionase family DNA binding protein